MPVLPAGVVRRRNLRSPKLRRFIGSHNSYQFGDSDQRQLKPVSRLEFPLDSWWSGLEVGYAEHCYSWRLELMTNISCDTDSGRMYDSDWYRTQPSQA